jgi:hypothetical protein
LLIVKLILLVSEVVSRRGLVHRRIDLRHGDDGGGVVCEVGEGGVADVPADDVFSRGSGDGHQRSASDMTLGTDDGDEKKEDEDEDKGECECETGKQSGRIRIGL